MIERQYISDIYIYIYCFVDFKLKTVKKKKHVDTISDEIHGSDRMVPVYRCRAFAEQHFRAGYRPDGKPYGKCFRRGVERWKRPTSNT